MSAAGDRWLEFARQDLQMAELALKEGLYIPWKSMSGLTRTPKISFCMDQRKKGPHREILGVLASGRNTVMAGQLSQ